MLKFLIGGSPCTFWSIAQKDRETEPTGQGWELFKNYVIAKEKFVPDYFIYENNNSISKQIKECISAKLGVENQTINSALVSAQERKRLYWTNIPEIRQPEDKGIKLEEILEDIPIEDRQYSIKQLNKATIVGRRINNKGHREDYNKEISITQCLEVRKTNVDKSNCLTTVEKDNVLTPLPAGRHIDPYTRKLPFRYYTVAEYCRLQTLPDDYTKAVSDSKAKKLLGNGWTVDVIAHILAGLKRKVEL